MSEPVITKAERLRDVLTNHGWDLIYGLVVIIVGFLAVRLLVRLLKKGLEHVPIKPAWGATAVSVINVLLNVIVIAMAAGIIGFNSENIFKFLVVLALVSVAAILFIRPYIPSLPFKVGNTIKSGEFLGKIEAITLINTRMRTFDGKTVWIPNTKIGKEYLINYHYTPTRKIHLDVTIGYEEDLMHAKQTLEAVMIADPRVLTSPRPVVYVTHLKADVVALGGRCWVDNMKYWPTRCDLLEKIKLRFDAEGIAFALPQQIVNLKLPQGIPDGFMGRTAPVMDAEDKE
jgi:small conductance mechanosensitive channel